MSVKNKSKDRNKKGLILREYTCNDNRLKIDSAPKAWVNTYMTRPKRRIEKNCAD